MARIEDAKVRETSGGEANLLFFLRELLKIDNVKLIIEKLLRG